MALIVDYDDLEALGRAINTSAGDWFSALENTSNAVKTLSGSPNIKGKAVDNVKSYIETVHGSIITALVSIISAHTQNYLLYKREYQGNVDSALHARILQDEILDIKDLVQKNKTKTQEIDITIKNAIADISDIVYLGFPGSVTVERTEDDIIKDIIELDNDIVAVENRHYSADFTETGRLIDEAEQFILQQIGTHRQYKASFDVKSLGSNTKFINFVEALSELAEVQNGKSSAVEKAYEDEEKWQEQLYEERQREAEKLNWLVTGACIVGSAVAIIATGGAATPLVVATISGVSGFVSAGTRSLTNQYVESGDWGATDWSKVGKDALLGGATGFVTGYIGASLGPVVTTKLSNIQSVSNALGSSSTVTRVVAHAFVGAATESTVGVGTRFFGTAISTGGDFNAAIKSATDIKSIAIDATIGGTTGAFRGIKSPNSEVKRIDRHEVKFKNEKYDKDEFARQLAEQEEGMNNLTVQEYLDNRERYCSGGRSSEGAAAQQAARQNAYLDKVAELREQGFSKTQATQQADEWMKNQAALHGPDQVAGGKPTNITSVGDKAINSSIGYQWKSRIQAVDDHVLQFASKMTEAERKSTYLNIHLTQ